MFRKNVIKKIVFLLLIGFAFVFLGDRVYAASCQYTFDTNFFASSEVKYGTVDGSQVEVIVTVEESGYPSITTSQFRYRKKDVTNMWFQYQQIKNDNFDDMLNGLEKFKNATFCPKLALCWLEEDEKYQLYYEEADGTVIGCLNSEKNLVKNPEIVSSGFASTNSGNLKGCSDETRADFEIQFQNKVSEINEKYQDELKYISNFSFDASSNPNDSNIAQIFNSRTREFSKQILKYVNAIKEDSKSYDCDEIVNLGMTKIVEFQKDADGYLDEIENQYITKIKNYIAMLKSKGEIEKANQYTELLNKIEFYSEDVKNEHDDKLDEVIAGWGEEIDANCDAILGDLRDLIEQVFNVIKIAAPILLIFFGSMDFAKAVIAGDDKATKKATSDFMKRAIAAVLIFFLPWFIEFLFNLPGLENFAEDVLCGVGKVVLK